MKHDISHDPIFEISLHYGEIQIEKYTIKRSLSGFSNCFWKYYILPVEVRVNVVLTASHSCCYVSTFPVSGEISLWQIENN